MSVFQPGVFQPDVFAQEGAAAQPSGPTPAGRSRRRRHQIILGDRMLSVDERDLPALLDAWLARGESKPRATRRERRQVRREALPALLQAPSEQTQQAPAEMRQRYSALLPQVRSDPPVRAMLEDALRRALERAAFEADEDDIAALLLAH